MSIFRLFAAPFVAAACILSPPLAAEARIVSSVVIAFGPARQIFSYDLASDETTPLGQSRGLFWDLIFIDPLSRYALVSSQETVISPPDVERIDLFPWA